MYKQVGHRTQYVPWGDGAGGAQDFSPKAFLVDMLEKAILGNRIICTNSENGSFNFLAPLFSRGAFRKVISDHKSHHRAVSSWPTRWQNRYHRLDGHGRARRVQTDLHCIHCNKRSRDCFRQVLEKFDFLKN